MNKEELIENLEIILECVATCSSENEKYIVLDDLKPSSFEYIIKEVIDFIEGVET